MNRRETYESDTRRVTDGIQTPVAVGQGQHGTARWLRANEFGKAFSVHDLDPKDAVFAALFGAGLKDVRGVDKGGGEEREVESADKTMDKDVVKDIAEPP